MSGSAEHSENLQYEHCHRRCGGNDEQYGRMESRSQRGGKHRTYHRDRYDKAWVCSSVSGKCNQDGGTTKSAQRVGDDDDDEHRQRLDDAVSLHMQKLASIKLQLNVDTPST